MQSETKSTAQDLAVPRGRWLGHLLVVLRLLLLFAARRRQRGVLATLEAHELRDIGRSREEALREAAKPFWRA